MEENQERAVSKNQDRGEFCVRRATFSGRLRGLKVRIRVNSRKSLVAHIRVGLVE